MLSLGASLLSPQVAMTASASAHAALDAGMQPGKKRSRERAITLAGAPQAGPYTLSSSAALVASASGLPVVPMASPDASAPAQGPPPASPPPSTAWRASTGRHELSQRQLGLLREMLGNAPAPAPSSSREGERAGGEEPATLRVDRDWRWGDARNSTITLPAEDADGVQGRRASMERSTRRAGGRLGMAGIRDMLRALKRGASAADASAAGGGGGSARRAAQSTTSLSTQSSNGSRRHRYPHPRIPGARRGVATTGVGIGAARASSGPETVRASRELSVPPRNDPATTPHGTFVPPKPSPRRPSLASIFRIGTKNRAPSASAAERVAAPSSFPSSLHDHNHTETPNEDSDAPRGEQQWTGRG